MKFKGFNVGANATCTINTLCLLGKGAWVRTIMHAQEFLQDKIKCEVADKLCMASHVPRRKREHQYNLHWVVTHGILGTRLRNLGYELYVFQNTPDRWKWWRIWMVSVIYHKWWKKLDCHRRHGPAKKARPVKAGSHYLHYHLNNLSRAWILGYSSLTSKSWYGNNDMIWCIEYQVDALVRKLCCKR